MTNIATPAAGQPITAPPRPTVWPTLIYTDAPGAVRFLVDAFGFEVATIHHGSTEATVTHAELRWQAGGALMLGSARPESVLADLPPDTGSVYVVAADPDALFTRARAAGATVVREPMDTGYGSREFTVRDPAGVYWSFGTYQGA